jgi:type IV pilus secretin PilQ/predicted competence protein
MLQSEPGAGSAYADSSRFAAVDRRPVQDYVLSDRSQTLAALTGTASAQSARSAVAPVRRPQIRRTFKTAQATQGGQSASEGTGTVNVRGASAGGDPMNQIVDIDFRDMELRNAVAILRNMANVNVVAGPALTGTVNASLKDVPLRKALEILLKLNNLGMIEEDGIITIVPYAEAASTNRTTQTVYLSNGNATGIATTLGGVIGAATDSDLVSISPNDTTNIILIAGPPARVAELAGLAQELDIAKPVLPTVTVAIPLNYADPVTILPVVQSLLTLDVGKAEADVRGRHIIVTDAPAVVEQVRSLIQDVDKPVKRVSLNALLVDVVLRDSSEIGANWLFGLNPDVNSRGETIGDFAGASLASAVGGVGTSSLDAGILNFSLFNEDYSLAGALGAEVTSGNVEILANPTIIATENRLATIDIVQDFPYQQLQQSTQGPPMSTTNFKQIGVTLNVTPRVTHDNTVIVDIDTKESSVSALTEDGVPIEERRQAATTLPLRDGQTAFIGGLRSVSDTITTNKIPVLGDIPVLNFMFKNTSTAKVRTELMIFLTAHVMEDFLPELTPAEQEAHDKLGGLPRTPDAQRSMFHDVVAPGDMRDPAWKWRRSK